MHHDSPRCLAVQFIADDSGQDLIEYALLTAIIGISGVLILQDALDNDGRCIHRQEYGGAKRMAAVPATIGRTMLVNAQGINMNSVHIVGLTIASLACVTDLRTRQSRTSSRSKRR